MSYFSVWNKLDTILCSERLGEARSCQAMMEFSNFIFYQGLMDLPFVGGSFTWSNNRDSFAWSGVGSPVSWCTQRRLPRLCLDHFPILVDCGDFLRVSRSFKFEIMRLKSEGFVDQLK
jgi:hypothetical protein